MDKIYSNPASEFEQGQLARKAILPVLDSLYTDCSKWKGTAAAVQRAIAPFLKRTNCFDVKSGTEIWDVLCKAFMGLQFDYLSQHNKEIGNKPIKASWLLLGEDDDPLEIEGLSFIERFASESTRFLVYGDDTPPKKQDKRPIFDLEVGEYELQAVLFYEPGHYTSCVKVFTDWVYYDDLPAKTRRLASPGNFIFKESERRKAQMLFYTRKEN